MMSLMVRRTTMRSLLRFLRRCVQPQNGVTNELEREAFKSRKQAAERRLQTAMQRLGKQAESSRRQPRRGDDA